MSLTTSSRLGRSFGIRDENLLAIKVFLQGSVYCWVKNRSDEAFAAGDLVGGENYDWNGTPLIVLYEKHICGGKNHDKAVEEGGKDLGWILKLVLHEDRRVFEDCDVGMAQGYRWIKQ